MCPMAKRKTAPRKPRKPIRRRRRHHHDDEDIITTILRLERFIMAISQSVSDALDRQDQKLAEVSRKVDDFIAAHPPVDPADNDAIVARLSAQGQALDAISAKLV